MFPDPVDTPFPLHIDPLARRVPVRNAVGNVLVFRAGAVRAELHLRHHICPKSKSGNRIADGLFNEAAHIISTATFIGIVIGETAPVEGNLPVEPDGERRRDVIRIGEIVIALKGLVDAHGPPEMAKHLHGGRCDAPARATATVDIII